MDLNGMLVEQIIPKARERLSVISHDASVREAAALMSKHYPNLIAVCGADGKLVGVVTKMDIVQQIEHCSGSGCTCQVSTIMTRNVVSCRPHGFLHDVWSVMKERDLQRIPIIDQNDKPLGVIYARDALQSLLGEVQDEESLLRDYVMGIGYR